MSNEIHHKPKGSRTPEEVTLHGRFTTTTNGTIDSTGSANCIGFSVARSAAGVYVCTLDQPYVTFLNALGTIDIGTHVAGKGLTGRVKASDMSAKTVTVAFTNDLGADADVPDGATVRITIFLGDSLLAR